jgi:hypothetical protein
VPSNWSKARTRQVDREGRWTIKRGRKPKPVPGETHTRQAGASNNPGFGGRRWVLGGLRFLFVADFRPV